jgi:hypothetical protein
MIDTYTKVVLTMIACALFGLLAQNLIGPSSAQSAGLMKVQICDAPDRCAALGGQRQGGLSTYSLMVSTR